jgi:protocatechuate 3,4-dioxygenase beta subunit
MNRVVSFLPTALLCLIPALYSSCEGETDSAGADGGKSLSASQRKQDEGAGPTLKKDASRKSSGLGKILVKLQDRDSGKPVTGAGVRLLYSPAGTPGRVLPLDTMTNLDGEALFEPGPVARAVFRTEFDVERNPIELAASGETRVDHSVQTRYELAGRVIGPDGRGVENAHLFLARYAPGQSLGEGNAPIPGSGMELEEFRRFFGYDLEAEVQTKKDGHFTCTLKTCQTLLCTAFKEGLLCPGWQIVGLDLAERRYEDAEIRLHPSARLEVTLFDARRRPLADRPLHLIESFESRAMRSEAGWLALPFNVYLNTDKEGRDAVSIPAGITLSTEGHFFYSEQEEGAPLPDPLHSEPMDAITLDPGSELRVLAIPHETVLFTGVVQDRTGAPVEGATVMLAVNSMTTDEAGRFRLLVPYNIHLRMAYSVSKKGFQMTGDLLPEIEKGVKQIDVKPVIEPATSLILTLPGGFDKVWLSPAFDPSDRVSRCSSNVEVLPLAVMLMKGQRQGRNTFFFEEIEEEKYTVLAQTEPFQFARLDGLSMDPSAGMPLAIDLEGRIELPALPTDQEAWIEGKLILPEGMKPHTMEVILVRGDFPEVRPWDPLVLGKSQHGWSKAKPGPDGTFTFEGLPPGHYTLAAAAFEWDSRIDAYGEAFLRPGKNEIELKPAAEEDKGSLSLILTDEEGSPLSGLSVLLLDPADSPIGFSRAPDFFFYSNGEGKILIERLPPGRYSLAVSRFEGREPLCDARVEIRPGEGVEASIALAERP